MKQRTPTYLALALVLVALAAGGTGLLPRRRFMKNDAGRVEYGRAQHVGHDRDRRHPPGGRQRESREGVHGGHQHAIAEEQYLTHREPGDDSLRRRMAHARAAQEVGAGVPSQKGDALPIRAR